MTTSRATLVDAARLDDDGAARRWLAGADGEAVAGAALARLNRALYAQRAASADPGVHEVTRAQALVVRVGFGAGEEVADGRWTRAVELPGPRDPGRRARALVLRPQERLAALLGGRDVALACEELTLRARADLDAGRRREAALQLGVALDAALAELVPWAQEGGLVARVEELRAARPRATAAAAAALEGGLDDAAAADVAHVLARLEAALRARTAGTLR